ncbi:heterokaryon incompatibility protein-domain-containing protein [Cerioporus squamosus]|nr:heterokaryon incompatibility protein-domain-containing protein [Cerioporus squamosus]
MRLLDTTSGRFKIFQDPRAIRYAILSHVWAKPDRKNRAKYMPEQTYQEICKLEQETPANEPVLHKLSPKIQAACKIAQDHDFSYIWIDSGCIDKSSSAELSEAINSMFEWYRHANMCYAVLEDVEDYETIARAALATSRFRNSKWFRRGWTLQELVAPHHVLFVSKGWKVIGTKAELADVVADVTLIRRDILLGELKLEDVPVAERMSWASKRETTREEDEAYCLLGIFGIQMSPIYGEGRYAFIRLQEEILRQTADPTILAWGFVASLSDHFSLPDPSSATVQVDDFGYLSDEPDSAKTYLLALSPSSFESHSRMITMSTQPILPNFDIYSTDFTFTAHGIRAKLPLITIYDKNKKPYRLALLGCKDQKGRCIALLLQRRRTPGGHDRSISIGASLDSKLGQNGSGPSFVYYRLLALEEADVQTHMEQFRLQDIYIPHRVPPSLRSQVRDETIHHSLEVYRQETEVSLAGWCHPLLKQRGFTVLPDPECYVPSAQILHDFALVERDDPQRSSIRIEVGLCRRDECRQRGLLQASVKAPRTPTFEPGSPTSDRPQCYDFHIASWIPANCVASKTFPIMTSKGDIHTLRLTFRLKSEPGKKYYVLEIELLDPLKGKAPTSPRSLLATLNPAPASVVPDAAAGRTDEHSSSEHERHAGGRRGTMLPSSPPSYATQSGTSSSLGMVGLPGQHPNSFSTTTDAVRTGSDDANILVKQDSSSSDSHLDDDDPPAHVRANSGTSNLPKSVPNPVSSPPHLALPDNSRTGILTIVPNAFDGNPTVSNPVNTIPDAAGEDPITSSASPPSDRLLVPNGGIPEFRMGNPSYLANSLPANAYSSVATYPPLSQTPPPNPYSSAQDFLGGGFPNSPGGGQNPVGSHPNYFGLPPHQLMAAFPHLYGGVPFPFWSAYMNPSFNPYGGTANSVGGVPNLVNGVPNFVNGAPGAPGSTPNPVSNVTFPNQSPPSEASPVPGLGPSEPRSQQESGKEKRTSKLSMRRFLPGPSWSSKRRKA